MGVKVVLVHGIGPEVRQALKDAGKELPVVDGFPQVNEDAIDLVQETSVRQGEQDSGGHP